MASKKLTEDFLRQEFLINDKIPSIIAEENGSSETTVRRLLQEHNLIAIKREFGRYYLRENLRKIAAHEGEVYYRYWHNDEETEKNTLEKKIIEYGLEPFFGRTKPVATDMEKMERQLDRIAAEG